MVNGPEYAWVVVATLAKVLAPLKYGMLPTTAAEEVERPPNEMALVERMRGQEKVRALSLPLRVVCKSVPLRESVPKYALVEEA